MIVDQSEYEIGEIDFSARLPDGREAGGILAQQYGDRVELQSWWVWPQYRDQKHGKELINSLKAKAKELGANEITGTCSPMVGSYQDYLKVRQIYRHLGITINEDNSISCVLS